MWQTVLGAIQKIWWDIENKKPDVSKALRSEAKASATEKLRRGRDVPQDNALEHWGSQRGNGHCQCRQQTFSGNLLLFFLCSYL